MAPSDGKEAKNGKIRRKGFCRSFYGEKGLFLVLAKKNLFSMEATVGRNRQAPAAIHGLKARRHSKFEFVCRLFFRYRKKFRFYLEKNVCFHKNTILKEDVFIKKHENVRIKIQFDEILEVFPFVIVHFGD